LAGVKVLISIFRAISNCRRAQNAAKIAASPSPCRIGAAAAPGAQWLEQQAPISTLSIRRPGTVLLPSFALHSPRRGVLARGRAKPTGKRRVRSRPVGVTVAEAAGERFALLDAVLARAFARKFAAEADVRGLLGDVWPKKNGHSPDPRSCQDVGASRLRSASAPSASSAWRDVTAEARTII
jgi:hypothetical protein